MKNLAWLKGLIFGILSSLFSAWLVMFFGQILADGLMSFWGELWLYYAVIIPFAIAFTILGVYFDKNEVTNKKRWMISLLCAFFVTWFSGTIGAIFGEAIVRGGLDTLPIEDVLIWGTIYAFILLPITIFYARFLVEFLYHIIRPELKVSS
ncbi:hypothetical protein [Fervidibacillus halotolerans]|uniref:Uncharacterized protein n=1 Tax=Fervidibacillus halotolerans TaxID=2980027 RepID=A0A9E8LYM9_9BACI|nr:hypothetical protein [Fervidibacillus halotolerans]WAA11976.1 hypothetical protein OE105_10350 [Fervidibacillus halotolerans]